MKQESTERYMLALKAGQKYRREAVRAGRYPYPPVLDDLVRGADIAGAEDLGVVEIPTDRIVGTQSAGRTAALAGNFMPLLEPSSEFAVKWMRLCDAHLDDEGIREPIRCTEYMGRFYVREGNKRASVLKCYHAPSVPAQVTRLIPAWSDDPDVQVCYEAMWFYSLSRLYTPEMRQYGGYARLQAALGFSGDHVWTDEERRAFQAVYARFGTAFEKVRRPQDDLLPAEALLECLRVFSFQELRGLSPADLEKRLAALWPDILAGRSEDAVELNTVPGDKEAPLLHRVLSYARPQTVRIAFVYAAPPEQSLWTRSHDEGRRYLQESMGSRADIRTYTAGGRSYLDVIEEAADDGAQLIFATAAAMGPACRRTAALHPDVKILNCALFQPYTGVRMYQGRLFECKFITGAIAGAMAEGHSVGYIANYPIYGTPADINAFALGVRMTDPRARVELAWSCLPGDPVRELIDSGVTVISNREAPGTETISSGFELGTYLIHDRTDLLPLASACWQWGKMYEKIVRSLETGAWNDPADSKAINYWWGLDSGVIDVRWSPKLPDGVRSLGEMLRSGIIRGTVDPFCTRIRDQAGLLRNDGDAGFSPEEILAMDWLCDNVDGSLPPFEQLRPESRDTVRALGLYRESIPPEAGSVN